MTVPVLGCPSLEESYLSLANQSSIRGQAGRYEGGRGCALARRIGSVSLVAHGPKAFSLSSSRVTLLSINEATAPKPRQDGSQHSLFKQTKVLKLRLNYRISGCSVL